MMFYNIWFDPFLNVKYYWFGIQLAKFIVKKIQTMQIHMVFKALCFTYLEKISTSFLYKVTKLSVP
jgi:hypothetical protein